MNQFYKTSGHFMAVFVEGKTRHFKPEHDLLLTPTKGLCALAYPDLKHSVATT